MTRVLLALLASGGCAATLSGCAAILGGCAAGDGSGADSVGDSGEAGRTLRVVTFNTGTTEGMGHDEGPDDGYTAAHAETSDQWYGDGLAWLPAVEATREWLAEVDPDLVVFQEIFYSELCSEIPEEHHPDFVCETWEPGDPTVASEVLGPGWQVACHPGKDDKCAAVHERLGRLVGCEADFCLEGLDGSTIAGCGEGARVGRGLVETVDGAVLTLVNVHGSSGLTAEDQACRVAQVDQVFEDLGDGASAVGGPASLVMGDLNTDPGRWTGFDDSAVRWAEEVDTAGAGDGRPFAWISEVGEEAPGSYGGVADIDHVASDVLTGTCWHAGLEGHEPVTEATYFDHLPVVCEVRW